MQSLLINHNQKAHLSEIINNRIHVIQLFLEPDMKECFTSEEVLNFQSEKVELEQVLHQLKEG